MVHISSLRPRRALWRAAALACGLALQSYGTATLAQTRFAQTNLVADLPSVAAAQDPNLVNAWGIAFAPGGPFWISDNHTGLSSVYSTSGVPLPLVVTVPPPAGSLAGTMSSPTGQVYSGAAGFHQASGAPAVFTFATEDGTISSWNPSNGTNAVLNVDNSSTGAVYKGLDIAQDSGKAQLYAADFHGGKVDVFDSNYASVNLGSGAFVDPTLPAGYAPFNIANLNGKLAVSYALQDAAQHDDAPGAGHGFVDLYNPDGSLDKRLISAGTLNSPWGMTIAPAGFGTYAGDLLVGNFGDGRINAFDPGTGAYQGTLQDAAGNPLNIPGLWALSFRTDVAADAGKLFFTAGPNGENNGLFGYVSSVPEPQSALMMMAGALCVLCARRRDVF